MAEMKEPPKLNQDRDYILKKLLFYNDEYLNKLYIKNVIKKE
jgi:hypothetical protein